MMTERYKNAKINLFFFGEIQGKLRVDLTDSEKKTLVEFVIALDQAGQIKGKATTKKFSDMVTYLGKKMTVKQCVLDAETVHMLWAHMGNMAGKVNQDDLAEYHYLMDMLAGQLDKAVQKIIN